jgi:MFS family permease
MNASLMPGSLLGGALNSWLGPRWTLGVAAAAMLASQSLIISAAGGVLAILASRVVQGLVAGITASTTIAYLTDLSTVDLRGVLAMANIGVANVACLVGLVLGRYVRTKSNKAR